MKKNWKSNSKWKLQIHYSEKGLKKLMKTRRCLIKNWEAHQKTKEFKEKLKENIKEKIEKKEKEIQ